MSTALFQIESLCTAFLVHRVNRFVAEVDIEGKRNLLSLNNTGRLEQLLRKGCRVFFVPHAGRKTAGKLIGVEDKEGLVLVDTGLQMKAFEVAFSQGFFPWLSMWFTYRRSPRLGNSVLDYRFIRESEEAYGEIKSALYRKGSLALYPDAPTERGRRHFQTLLKLQQKGIPTYIIFVVALLGVTGCAPFEERDKEVAVLLRKAYAKGVRVKSFHLSLVRNGVVALENSDFPVLL
ncbi:MAG: DNA/RNA nuclease SfsA [Atribacterota bacterium]